MYVGLWRIWLLAVQAMYTASIPLNAEKACTLWILSTLYMLSYRLYAKAACIWLNLDKLDLYTLSKGLMRLA